MKRQLDPSRHFAAELGSLKASFFRIKRNGAFVATFQVLTDAIRFSESLPGCEIYQANHFEFGITTELVSGNTT